MLRLKIKFWRNLLRGIILIGVELINECQRYSANGSIGAVLVDVADVNLDSLLSALAKKEFTTVKNWVVQHMDNDSVMRKIYDSLYGVLKPSSIPEAVLSKE